METVRSRVRLTSSPASLSWLEHGKIQLGRFAQPGCVHGVVFQIVSCQRVYKYVETLSVLVQPGNKRIKLAGIESQLTTPVGMRADRFLMLAPDRYSE